MLSVPLLLFFSAATYLVLFIVAAVCTIEQWSLCEDIPSHSHLPVSLLSLTAVLFQCMRRWWLGRTSGDLLTSCSASLTAGITPWPGDHPTVIIIIIIIIITDLCSTQRVQEMWGRSRQCRCRVGGGGVCKNTKILTGPGYNNCFYLLGWISWPRSAP